jgi:hypothetical protein
MHNASPDDGIAAILTSIGMTVISLATVQEVTSILAGCVAIISGCFAIRYYWLKINEVKTSKKSK